MNEQDWEDFRQFKHLKRLQGRKANNHQLLVDYFRQNFGDSRTKSIYNKRRILFPGEAKENILYENGEPISLRNNQMDDFQIENDKGRIYRDNIGGIEKYITGIKGTSRAIIVLLYFWGLNEVEISNLYNVSESRISQMVKIIQKRIYARAEKEKRLQKKSINSVEKILQKETARNQWGLGKKQDNKMEGKISFKMEVDPVKSF